MFSFADWNWRTHLVFIAMAMLLVLGENEVELFTVSECMCCLYYVYISECVCTQVLSQYCLQTSFSVVFFNDYYRKHRCWYVDVSNCFKLCSMHDAKVICDQWVCGAYTSSVLLTIWNFWQWNVSSEVEFVMFQSTSNL